MKLKRRMALEVPPKVKSFISSVTATPLENIEEPLKTFVWESDKGDFNHWVDLFNHFDTYFEKYIKSRKDLQLEDSLLESDPPFPRDAVLQILRVIRIILENCTNKHFYSSYEHHLSSLLASTDVDVVEACLQTLAAFFKKTIGKYIIRDSFLNSRLLAFAQGWGGKEEGLGLISCAIPNGIDPIAHQLACTLHFEFYAVDESLSDPNSTEHFTRGLQIMHLPDVNTRRESDLELLNNLVVEYKVPQSLRFSLLTRLRFARGFSSIAARQQYTCIRLYAFIVLVQACGDTDDLVSFFNTEPEFINELVALLSYEDAVSEKIRILSLLSLVALCQDRSRQPTVLTAVTSGGHRGILSSLMQKAIDSIVSNSSKWSVVFAEALLSLVTVFVSSSSGCSAMREAGFIPTLLPLLKDTDPQHLHLVSTAVHVLEAFMDYSNPAAALFRDLGGLDDTILRLKMEVSHVDSALNQQSTSIDLDSLECTGSQVFTDTSPDLDSLQPLYSESLVAYHRRSLMKALLRAISLGTYAPGTTARIYGSEESLLPHCLCIIFKRAKDFGGGVFALTATVMSDLIHKDPTCFPVLEAAGIPSTFMDAIMDGILCSAEAIACIPQCLDALCLNNNGLQAVKDHNALRCFVEVFTSKTYLRALTGDTLGSLSSGLDELMRHASSLRGPGVDMLLEILNTIAKIGSGHESINLSTDNPSCSQPVPMETEAENRDIVSSDDRDSCRAESCEQSLESASDSLPSNVESYLPDCISNVARLLETILQNSDTCRIFVEKKGIECVLQLFTLPLMPLSVALGQSISVAFKNFSPQHSASLAQAVCSFLREHLKSTNELLTSVGGSQLAQVEVSKRIKVLRCLSSLEGILSLSNSLLKGTTTIVSELGSADADVLKDLGRAYREILWHISLCFDAKVDEKQNVEAEPESADTDVSNVSGRENDDSINIPSVRYMDPVSIRNSSLSQWGGEREFLPVVRASDGFSRRNRHSWARLRGGRAGRHLEAFQIDSEAAANNAETSSQNMKKKSPDVLVFDILNKLASTLRSFFTALVKGFTSPNRRRTEIGSLSSSSKSIATALAKVFLEALGFSGYPNSAGLEISLSVKCRYLGKVVDDMVALTFDSRRRTCYNAMINNFYVHGTFKELLTTFEATSQLLWTLPYSISSPGADQENSGDGGKLSHSSWLLDTLQSHCRELEYFINSGLLLSSISAPQAQLLVQPVAVGLSIGLFPVPRDPEAFIRMLQSQVLDMILPVWNHPMFPNCNSGFITSIITLFTHVYSGVSDLKRNRNALSGSGNQRPPPDEATIATIVEMGFSRARAEEALRRVETNSVEMAMEWLFSHADEPVQDDDELAHALALSLGSSSETPKADGALKSDEVLTQEGQTKAPPIDDILAVAMKLFRSSDSMAFPLTDLLVTLCSRNKGENREKVISFLVQQLKLCLLEFSKDASVLCMISHTLALLLSEDGSTQEIAAQNGVVSIAIDILVNFMAKTETSNETLFPKCISALLLILDNLVQPRPKISVDSNVGTIVGSIHGSSESHMSSEPVTEKNLTPAAVDKESAPAFENILGKPTGHLMMEESRKVMSIVCDLIKRHVPAMAMQAVLQICARLTKSHALAVQFLEGGGMAALFGIPRSCFFPGYDTLASAIVRHLLEDPQTLQTAMELEIRQTLSGNRHAGRISVKTFLTSMAPVISRDPEVFMKAVASVCQLESSGGRHVVVLSKDKEKEREKSKASGVEVAVSTNECVRISESKAHDGFIKYSKGHKKVSMNLTQVIDYLLEIVSTFHSYKVEDSCPGYPNAMVIDETTTKMKGKSKVDETIKMGSDSISEKSAALAKVTFVLKLLSDILLMYVHAVGVILKRDLELCQLHGSSHLDCPGHGGIVHHVLHCLIPLSVDKSAGPDEWRDKLSEKASWFLVVLAGRSSEGRRRVINELVKTLSLFSSAESNSSNTILLPDKKVLAFVDLVYSILSKNFSSGNSPGSGCSPDIAKSMIDGGMVQCLSGILQVIDLDHPDAPKIVNLILKALESLTRAANASEQIFKSDPQNKKKLTGPSGRSDSHTANTSVSQELQCSENRSGEQLVTDNIGSEVHPFEDSWNDEGDHANHANPTQSMEQEMRTEEAPVTDPPVVLGMDYNSENMENSGALSNGEQIEMNFHVDDRVDEDVNDEDDDMGEDDEDEDDGEDEDEDIAEDGTALMSLADTDVEDHDDVGLGDEYNDDMVDEEDDDFPENRVIEVRWREALDGLDHLQLLGQPGSGGGLIDISAEPFEGVNVDDFFGIRRSFGFERRRQTNRTSYERSVTAGNGLQHPLLSRPSHSGDLGSIWSSGGHSSRNSEALSTGNLDLAHFYMFDAPVLPYDNAASSPFGDRLSGAAPPPLADFSVGLESLRVSGRRGPGDGRWSDDGQPQAGGQAAVIAQAIEEQFIVQLTNDSPTENPAEVQSHNPGLPERLQGDPRAVGGDDAGSQQNNDNHNDNGHQVNQLVVSQEEINQEAFSEQAGDCVQGIEPISNLNGHESMEIGDGNANTAEQLETSPGMVPQVDVHCDRSVDVLLDPSVPYQDDGYTRSSEPDNQPSCDALMISGSEMSDPGVHHASSIPESTDVDMNTADVERDHTDQQLPVSEINLEEPSLQQNNLIVQDAAGQTDESSLNNEAPNANGIDPTFLEALPEYLRAEVLASQQAQSAPAPTYTPPAVEDIDPEFLAALPPDIQAEVLAQQRVQRITQQSEGQPVDMDNASIIATLPADLREEVLLTSSEAVLSALPSPLLAEAQMLRDRAMSHYHAHSLFGGSHRLTSRRNGLGFDRQTAMDRGIGVTIGRRASSLAENLKLKELEGEPFLDANGLKGLIRLLRLAQPLGKGLLQRLLLNLCAHGDTRAILVHLLLDMIKPEPAGIVGGLTAFSFQRLYGCQSDVVYGRSQLFGGLPPLVLRRVLEILAYLATNHSAVASLLFYFNRSIVSESANINCSELKNDKGKEKIIEEDHLKTSASSQEGNVPLILFLRLLSQPLFLRSAAQLEQVMGLLQVVVYAAASKLDLQSHSEETVAPTKNPSSNEIATDVQKDPQLLEIEVNQLENSSCTSKTTSDGQRNLKTADIFLLLPQSDLHNLCTLLGQEGLSDKVYMLAGEVLRKLATVAAPHRKFFILELSDLAQRLSSSAVNELVTLRDTHMLGLRAGSMAGAAVLRVLQTLSSLTSTGTDSNRNGGDNEEQEEQSTLWKLNVALEPLWKELSECISTMETELTQSSRSSVISNINTGEQIQGSSSSPPLPPGTQRLLPFIEGFFVLCEKLQANNQTVQQDHSSMTAREVKECAGSSVPLYTKCGIDSYRRFDGSVTFARFAEKHRRLLNAFVRQNPGLLEKSLSMMLKAPRLIDFDNKKSHFRSRIRQQHDQHVSGPLRISVRRAFVLEDSYNQLRMRPSQDLKGRLNVHFQGEEGIDAGGLTREWYQVLSRVIFDKGALLFTNVGNNATFQPNPNSVYQTEHLSYFRFVGRVVAKALFDGQLLDVYFTRSFYKHILGVKVTYHDIEAVDPDYYKNLKWMLEVPLEGFKALQGISGAQRFQIHKAYGAPERLPSAHTCFNQLDLPEYSSKELLEERLLLAIHEASEGFGFG
ncbi:E3 ubiquitin- ligase UPL1-like [Olea europaea subsp. europaea]|uniref:HECT-type E3 ubiquitin transferase n=1 Tax=Olea europaea subsp. europaea TaxID=158383 RepID=A0A8S0UIU9_OLEEU|nr:E3 ubiquitin- ligase UPL1-like [Olea europaea subsp. europaea]